MHVCVPSLRVCNICGIIFDLSLYKDVIIGTFIELQRLRLMERLQRTGQETARNILSQLTTRTTQGEREPSLDGKVM